jgi:hypothetical protein
MEAILSLRRLARGRTCSVKTTISPDWISRFRELAKRLASVREEIGRLVLDLGGGHGKRITAYAAAGGMATALLAGVGLNSRALNFAVDINEAKHGR